MVGIGAGIGVGRRMIGRNGGSALDPAIAIFADGSNGFYYDFGQLSSLYQDAAGTIPVTSTGQPIGLAKDRSGNNNGATASGTARPAWQADGSGLFDGVNDSLLSTYAPGDAGTVLFGANANAGQLSKVFLGGRNGSAPVSGAFAWINASGTVDGVGGLIASAVASGVDVRGSNHTIAFSWDGTLLSIYIDGSLIKTAAQTSAVSTAIPFTLGAINSGNVPANFYGGEINKSVAIARALTPTEIANISAYWSTH